MNTPNDIENIKTFIHDTNCQLFNYDNRIVSAMSFRISKQQIENLDEKMKKLQADMEIAKVNL